MKAIVLDRNGPTEVLRRAEVPTPAPARGEVRVAVEATTLCSGDLRLRGANLVFLRLYGGPRRPNRIGVLGMELSGRLLAADSADAVEGVLGRGPSAGFIGAAVVGQFVSGPASIFVDDDFR